MPTEHELPTDHLLAVMHGNKSMIGEWDILVSYHVDQLNKLLASLWSKDRKTDFLKVQDPEPSPNSFVRNRLSQEFEFGSPRLGFETSDTGCMASLTIALSGKVTSTPYRKKNGVLIPDTDDEPQVVLIPKDTVHLRIVVPVKSVDGSVNEDHLDEHVKSPGTVIHLGEEESSASHIVLHFSSMNAVYKIESVAGKDTPLAVELSGAIGAIQAWFSSRKNVSAIHYRLATVKAIQDTADSNALLKPKSFMFASNGDVLCIYIQTYGSGNDPGDTEAKFTSGGTTIRPIPKGATASIIISHKLFEEKVFLQQLYQYSSEKKVALSAYNIARPIPHTKGFSYKFYVIGDIKADLKSKSTIWASTNIPEVKINLGKEPTTLVIEDNKAIWTFSSTEEVKWYNSSLSAGATLFPPPPNYADIKITVAQTTTFAEVKDNSTLAIDLSIKGSAYKITKTMRTGGHMPEAVDKLIINFQDVVLKSPNLNFIAAESVLAPGMTMVDITNVYTPYDVMLVGNLRDHATSN